MKLGSADITGIKLGSADVAKLMLGSTEIWSAAEPLPEEFWRDPVVAATTVYDPAYYDWETGVTSPQTVNLERGQLADPLDHPHCPQAVIDGWANRVEITTAQNPNTVINSNPQGSVFVLKAGTHQNRQITALRPGDILVGEPGAVLDGSGISGTSAASCRAIYTETGQGTIVYNVVIQNYPLYDNGTTTPPGEALMVRGGRILNCEVNDCGNIGIKMEGPDTIVRWCIVRRCGRLNYSGGTWWETYPHADLEGYRLEYCESDTAHVGDAFDQTWEACHKWVRVTGMQVRFNYFHDMRGYGIWFDGTVHDNVIEYNVCANGERSGIHYELGNDGIIRHNTIEGCGGPGAIFISNSSDCNVHGNYLRWNSSGLWVTDEGTRSPPGRNNTLHHNIVYQQLVTTGAGAWPSGKASVHYGNSTNGHLPAVTGNVWHNNTYRIDDGAAGANLDSTELFMWLPENKSGDAGEMSFASWSALAGEVGSTIEYAAMTGEPEPGPTTILFDTFTDTDGTDLLAHTPDEGDWTNDTSTWEIHGNKLKPQGAYRHAWVDAGSTEASIEATVNLGADGNIRQAGLSIRFVDGNNLWYVVIGRAGDGGWSSCTLQRIESGTWNQVAVGPASIAASTDYVLRAEVVGNTLSVFLDDVPQFTHDISAVYSTSTLFGVSVGANTDAVVTFDDVTVEIPPT